VLTRTKIEQLLRENLPDLSTKYGIRKIGLFGSFVNGEPNEKSDIDLVVEFEHPIGLRFIGLVEYLEHLLGRKVDLLTPAGIQGIVSREWLRILQRALFMSERANYRVQSHVL